MDIKKGFSWLLLLLFVGCSPYYRSEELESAIEFPFVEKNDSRCWCDSDYDKCFFYGKYSGSESDYMGMVYALSLTNNMWGFPVENSNPWTGQSYWEVPSEDKQFESDLLYGKMLGAHPGDLNGYFSSYYDGTNIYVSAYGRFAQLETLGKISSSQPAPEE